MTEEEILKEKIEEEQKEDTGATLPPSETVEAEVELNSSPEPTPEQIEAAGVEAVQDEPVSETTEVSETVESEPMTEEQESVEKMLSQSQVNEIVGRTRTETRDGTLKSVYDRYGVSDEAGMDDMAGRSQKYDLLREDYDNLAKELSDIKVKLAMYDSEIAPERYEDARLILTGKGLDVTAENIKAEMETHPEWKKALPTPANAGDEVEETFKKRETPVSTISVLGNDTNNAPAQSGLNERESALKMFY